VIPTIKNTKDFWAGIIYSVVGVSAFILSRDYEMGSVMRMGPAYFPTVLGGLLSLIGMISLARSFLRPGVPVTGYAFRGLLLVTVSTFLFGFLVRGAGLVIALPVLVVVSSYASSRFRLSKSLVLAAGLTMFCILIFLKGLGVPLPVLGSWFVR